LFAHSIASCQAKKVLSSIQENGVLCSKAKR